MSLLTVEEYLARQPEASDLETDALQAIIDANEVLLILRVGPLDATTKTVTVAGYPATVILLPERAFSIEGITEQYVFGTTDLELDEDDWRLAPQGTAVERIVDGPNPRDTFGERLIIEFTPYALAALWKTIIFQLSEADRAFSPGIQSRVLGDYSESKSSSAKGQASIASIKEDILAQLEPALPVFA